MKPSIRSVASRIYIWIKHLPHIVQTMQSMKNIQSNFISAAIWIPKLNIFPAPRISCLFLSDQNVPV
jgi:hypothetical protein